MNKQSLFAAVPLLAATTITIILYHPSQAETCPMMDEPKRNPCAT